MSERHQGRDENAALIGGDLALEPGLRLVQHDARACDGSARGICDRAPDDACGRLRLCNQ